MTTEAKTIDTAIADRIRVVMKRHGMNQKQMAVYLGVPQGTFNNWMQGIREPNSSVVRLLDVLGIVEVMAPAVHATLVPEPTRPRKAVQASGMAGNTSGEVQPPSWLVGAG